MSAAKIMLCNKLPQNSVEYNNKYLFLAHWQGSDYVGWSWQGLTGLTHESAVWLGLLMCL